MFSLKEEILLSRFPTRVGLDLRVISSLVSLVYGTAIGGSRAARDNLRNVDRENKRGDTEER